MISNSETESNGAGFTMRIHNKALKLGYCGFGHFSKSKIQPPRVVRVTNHIAHLGRPKEGPKPRQLLSLPPFPGHPLPGKSSSSGHVTAISWLKYYFNDILDGVIRSHFNKGLVSGYPQTPLYLFICFEIYLDFIPLFFLVPSRYKWNALNHWCPLQLKNCKNLWER